jgi:hypothetical protein
MAPMRRKLQCGKSRNFFPRTRSSVKTAQKRAK